MAGKWMFNHQQIGIEWEYIWEIVGDSLRQSPQKDGGLSLGSMRNHGTYHRITFEDEHLTMILLLPTISQDGT